MLNIDVRSDIEEKVKSVAWGYRDQVPFALALALTRTGQEVKEAERAEMERVFDRPTPYTLNSLFLRKATKANLEAVVWLREGGGKGSAAADYLAAEIGGGERKHKRLEFHLRQKGILPPGMFVVPGPAADIDSYGNVSRGYVTKMLSALRAFSQSGATANRPVGRPSRGLSKAQQSRQLQFFVSDGSRLAAGIWQRFGFAMSRATQPAFFFVSRATYDRRFKFDEVAQRIIAERLAPNFARALDDAIRTARI